MSAQQPTPPIGPYNPMFGLQEKIATLLTPIFQDENTNELFAYQISCRSLQAYEPESRADFVNIGRTIAFSLASLVVLKEAFNPALELTDKKKIVSDANALNRSADQAERSMMDRRRYQRAYPRFPVPQQSEPTDDHAQTQVEEAVTACTAAQATPPATAKPLPAQPTPSTGHPGVHYVSPNPASMPANHPGTLTTARSG